MSFPLHEQHYAHFLDEMPSNKEEDQANVSWERRQKIKLRLLAVAITVTFAVMVYVAMLILSSMSSSRPSESSSSASSSLETSIHPPTISPVELSQAPSTSASPSESPSETPSRIPSVAPTGSNWPSLNPSPLPTHKPTPIPTTRPTKPPTKPPTDKPTPLPTTTRPTKPPTNPPTDEPTPFPTTPQPTKPPTRKPTPFPITTEPTKPPTNPPTPKPTKPPTRKPTPLPTTQRPTKPPKSPTPVPTTTRQTPSPSTGSEPLTEPPSIEDVVTIKETAAPTPPPKDVELLETNFLVIGDIPYSIEEEVTLQKHIATIIPDDLEFMFHVGDIRDGSTRSDCTLEEFQNVAEILLQSPIPVFIVPGDNEYNDCPNFEESFENWIKVFGELETNWELPFLVSRDRERPENFYFIYRKVLYIGLNIVGGDNADLEEWETRLEHNFEWTKMLVNTFVVQPGASSVVIIGHADPRPTAHATFFDPLRDYMKEDLNNEIPFLYLNGDRHHFQFDEWMPNFHRIMVEGGTNEPPLRMTFSVPTSGNSEALEIEDLYSYERYLGVTER